MHSQLIRQLIMALLLMFLPEHVAAQENAVEAVRNEIRTGDYLSGRDDFPEALWLAWQESTDFQGRWRMQNYLARLALINDTYDEYCAEVASRLLVSAEDPEPSLVLAMAKSEILKGNSWEALRFLNSNGVADSREAAVEDIRKRLLMFIETQEPRRETDAPVVRVLKRISLGELANVRRPYYVKGMAGDQVCISDDSTSQLLLVDYTGEIERLVTPRNHRYGRAASGGQAVYLNDRMLHTPRRVQTRFTQQGQTRLTQSITCFAFDDLDSLIYFDADTGMFVMTSLAAADAPGTPLFSDRTIADIELDSLGNIIALDEGNNRVECRGRNGLVLWRTGIQGAEELSAITIDTLDVVYVLDQSEEELWRIDPLNNKPTAAQLPEILHDISSVAVDSRGMLYGLDRGREQLFIFMVEWK